MDRTDPSRHYRRSGWQLARGAHAADGMCRPADKAIGLPNCALRISAPDLCRLEVISARPPRKRGRS
jgi:hypothetical protein